MPQQAVDELPRVERLLRLDRKRIFTQYYTVEREAKNVMEVIEATVLGETHLQLSHPIQTLRGTKIFVAIGIAESVMEEHQKWVKMSVGSLESAYGPDEPDYPSDLVKMPNPEFQP
jgi:hypothetical protein